MMVEWIDPYGVLIESRHQQTVPREGQKVPVEEVDGSISLYHVGEVHWPLKRRRVGWYSPTDGAKTMARVYLVERGGL